jgi:hypothetical protein
LAEDAGCRNGQGLRLGRDDKIADVDDGDVSKLRLGMLALVGAGTTGMATELLLIGHFEEPDQVIPLAVAAVGLAAVAWAAAAPGRGALRGLQFAMLVYIGAGIIGITLHAEANVASQRELGSALTGLAFARQVLGVPAPPALSPGLLVQLGLLGLLSTYRHGSADGRCRLGKGRKFGIFIDWAAVLTL